MLEAAGVPFDTIESDCDEEKAKTGFREKGVSAVELAEALAECKARAAQAPAGALVLGSDQTLERDDGTMLDKPRSREDALAQLQSLRGRTHRLHSAAAIVEDGRTVWRAAESVELTMRSFGDAFLRDYLDKEYEAVRWGVGGYRVEGLGIQLFEKIEGSHFAILGLPLLPLLAYLRERGLMAR